MKIKIEKIITHRKSRNISIKKFAELLGVTTKTIYNWENGISKPGKTDILAIAHILNIRLNDISEYKESSLRYIKPSLNKNNSVHESTTLLKNMIKERNCSEYTNLLPLLHAEEDISRLVSENSRLLERVSRYKFLFELIDIPVYIKNSKRVVTFINQAFLNFFPENIKEYDIIGHKFSEIFSQKEYLPISKAENEAFNGSQINSQLIIFPFKKTLSKCRITIKPFNLINNIYQEIIVTINSKA